MSEHKVGSFEIRDHGIDGCQYFPGCSAVYTQFAHCVTGCGDTPSEALEDLCESIAQMGFDTDTLRERIEAQEGEFGDDPSAYQNFVDANEQPEPEREDFDSEEEWEQACEDAEEEQEALGAECDNYYYLSLLWNAAPTQSDLDVFTDAYIRAALWASTDEEGEPLDKSYTLDDINPEARVEMAADCAAFLTDYRADIGDDLEHAGHDFWLTRNHHGAGFWDGDWSKEAGRRLTTRAHGYGSQDLQIGDNGQVYVS